MNKVIIGVVILVLAAGGFFLFGNSKGDNYMNQAPTDSAKMEAKTEQTQSMSDVRTIEVEGGMFYFKPSEIQVKKGEKIKIVFINKEGMHDWVLDEFNVKTPQIKGGQKAEVEFIADRVGTFEYYCSVGNHRQQGMVGKLIVTE